MPGSTFRSTPVLVGAGLTSLCFVATGAELVPGVLLACLVVPPGVRTCLVLERLRAAGEPISVLSSLKTLLASAVFTAVLALWMLVVISITAAMKQSNVIVLPLLAIVGLSMCLAISRGDRRDAGDAEHAAIRFDWPRLFRVRFTIRGMLVGVALVAFALWPVHLWRMQPTYTAIASDEAFIADLCEAESEMMAERAERCRERAAQGAAWDVRDEASLDLKLCPFPNDGPGHSWREQAEIWKRAAKRCHLAARRHERNSARYEPWLGPSDR